MSWLGVYEGRVYVYLFTMEWLGVNHLRNWVGA